MARLKLNAPEGGGHSTVWTGKTQRVSVKVTEDAQREFVEAQRRTGMSGSDVITTLLVRHGRQLTASVV